MVFLGDKPAVFIILTAVGIDLFIVHIDFYYGHFSHEHDIGGNNGLAGKGIGGGDDGALLNAGQGQLRQGDILQGNFVIANRPALVQLAETGHI